MTEKESESPVPLDYAAPERRRGTPVSRTFAIIFALLGVGALLLMLTIPSQNHPYYNSQDKCASNLHQIGLGILLYANENGGVYPDALQILAATEGLTANVFVCPSSNDNPSTAPTTQGQIDDMAVPGHVSYIYLGKGLTDKTVQPNQVIAYEPLANHGNGIDVLLGDGHSEFVDVKRANKIIADAKASTRPVLLPP